MAKARARTARGVSACRVELELRNECKATLGLKPHDCYSPTNGSVCGDVEHELRKCLGLSSCKAYAEAVYGVGSQPMSRRLKRTANAQLQKCLKHYHSDELGCTLLR